ncbi:MAG: hypothetical protein ABIQ73_15400 [Acidimicrobiales bacterium]
MSYESVIDHMQRELVAGATRRRRRERIHRGVAAVVVATALVVGAVALTHDDQGASRLSTEPTAGALAAARTEVCNKFLDLQTNPPFPDSALALEQFATAAATSRDITLAQLATEYRDTYATGAGQVSSDRHIEALNALVMRCRALGTPGLNPVYVLATVVPPARVDLSAYGTEQMLRPTARPPLGVSLAQGRDLSPVQLAVSDRGAWVTTWAYNVGSPEDPRVCRSTGTQQGGGFGCRRVGEASVLSPPELRIEHSGGNTGDPTASIAVSDATSFVVFETGGQRYVQQPVAGITIFVWQLAGSSSRLDFTARAYDADGGALGCVASGSRSC